jgi:hypothetical protein
MQNSQPPPEPFGGTVNVETRIQILFEEYRALYSLLTFRLTAMDRRLPAIGGTLAGILCSIPAMPDATRLAFLLGLPIALLWLLLSTVQHARSKEDHVRRIDEIERLVNELVAEELLVFQSRHPNKARDTGGRTGFGTVFAVLFADLGMLLACAFLFEPATPEMPRSMLAAYTAYLALCALLMVAATVRLTRYRYRRPPPDGPTIFLAHRLDSA